MARFARLPLLCRSNHKLLPPALDTAADITIIGPKLFKEVAALARLKDFKQSDKYPRTYTHEPFKLHGRMDLDIMFDERTMRTPVFIRMDARDPLLLSEGVCRQLGIISYHQDVLPDKETKPKDKMNEWGRGQSTRNQSVLVAVSKCPFQE